MKSIKSPVLLLFAALGLLMILQTGCEKNDGPLETARMASDSQIRLADNWSGELLIFLDSDGSQSIDAVAAGLSKDKRGAAVMFLPAEEGNKVHFSTVEKAVSEFQAQHGQVTSYSIAPAVPGELVVLEFNWEVDMGKEFELASGDLPEDYEVGDPIPVCAGTCSKFGGIQLVTYSGGGATFSGNCGNGQVSEVVQDALRSCFASEILATNKRCPNGCYCNYNNATTTNHTKNCFSGGATFTSEDGMCSLSISGPISVTAAITKNTGICKANN